MMLRCCKPLVCCVLLLTASAQAEPVIFDSDMAIDDWAALLFLQKHPAVELLAVTVSASGEAHCDPGTSNALALLELAKPESQTKVACGDASPLDGYLVFPAAWRKDADTLSGMAVVPAVAKPESVHAVELIHTTLANSAEPVVILATGPLTNLAQWWQRYPEDAAKVSRIVVMGGTVQAPGNIIVAGFTDGHPNHTAEWNFFVDPLAADIVLRSGLKVELVGLDVTNLVRVTAEFAQSFKAQAHTPVAQFWDGVLDKNDWFIASGEYYFWDVLAAITVVDGPRYCRGETAALGVSYSTTTEPYAPSTDLSMPSTRWDGAARQHLDAATAGTVSVLPGSGNVLVCNETDAAAALQSFIDTVVAP